MFDVKQAEQDAQKELAEERAKKAKNKIKAKLSDIAVAKRVVANLEREYEFLLKDIGTE